MTTMTRRLAALMLALLTGCARQKPANLTVSVASSLETVMTEIVAPYPQAHVDMNFGASGALAQQIAAGAPVDLFFPPSSVSMDDLADRRIILSDTRRD